jgi:hypothetical protein
VIVICVVKNNIPSGVCILNPSLFYQINSFKVQFSSPTTRPFAAREMTKSRVGPFGYRSYCPISPLNLICIERYYFGANTKTSTKSNSFLISVLRSPSLGGPQSSDSENSEFKSEPKISGIPSICSRA